MKRWPNTVTKSDRPDPARIVADADVLAADLLIGGAARETLDHVRAHSWLELVASDPLLDDAEAVIAELADADLAADWRERIEPLRVRVEQTPGDHPALASVLAGNAAHLLTFDERLQAVKAGAQLRQRLTTNTSVKSPDAFARLFDPAALYPEVVGGEYPGPDQDSRT